jgi:DinB family protein
MVVVPDPVADPKGYQQALLSYLGDDDPAEVQAGTPTLLRGLVADAGADLRIRPGEQQWSVLECIGHIVGAEIVYSGRYRWIVAHDDPPLIGYDQDLWVSNLHANDDDTDVVLDMFESLRRANLDMWERSSPEERDRVGIHTERGPESYELSFRLIAGHDRLHHEQAVQTLERVREG